MGGAMDKIALIAKSQARMFSPDGLVATSHLVVFLLFGCPQGMRELFEARAANIVLDARAFVFLDVTEPEGAARQVQAAIDAARQAGAELSTLNRVHVCPFVAAAGAGFAACGRALESLLEHGKKRDIEFELKPFALLADAAGAAGFLGDAAAFLAALAQTGAPPVKMCLMTRQDETGLILGEARLLDTAALLAAVHASKSGRALDGFLRGAADSPLDCFYSAHSVFVQSPAGMRALGAMHRLLEKLLSDAGVFGEMGLPFLGDILTPAFAKLPLEDNMVTFAPLYGVMPEPDGDYARFMERLDEFAHRYYLSGFDFNRPELYRRIRAELLREFIKSGRGADYLRGLPRDEAEIGRLLGGGGGGLATGGLAPISAKGGMAEADMDVYAHVIGRVKATLDGMGRSIFTGFLESDEFRGLPELYAEAMKRIKNISIGLRESADAIRRSGDELLFELIDDPDAGLVDYAAKEPESRARFNRCVEAIAFGLDRNDGAAVSAAEEGLVDFLGARAGGLSGPDSARDFTALLSRTCHNTVSDLAQKCAVGIADRFKFPLRFAQKGKKRTFVWGSGDNHLFGVWDYRHDLFDTETEHLDMATKERIALLTVSRGFGVSDIKGLH